MVQGLRLYTSIAGGIGSIPDGGTKILNATSCSKKNEKKKSSLQTCLLHNQKESNIIYEKGKVCLWQ